MNNTEVRLPKTLRKKLRAMIHSYSVFKSGGAKEVDLKYRTWDNKSVEKLKGYLAYTKQVDEKTYNKLMHYAKSLNVNL